MMARMTTARVSRTRSSSRCWASGIFGSSIGEKTRSCSLLKKRLMPLSAILPAPHPHPPPRGGRDGWGCSSGVDHDEQGVALAVDQKDRVLVLFDLGRRRLEVLQPGDRLTVDLLDHVPALQPGLLRRAPSLHVGDHYAGRLRPDVELRPGLFINRLDAQIGQDVQGRSEEHTSELQSPCNLVCRLLLEKKKNRSCQLSLRYSRTPTKLRAPRVATLFL